MAAYNIIYFNEILVCTESDLNCVAEHATPAGVLSHRKPASARNLEYAFTLQFSCAYFIQES